MTSLFPSAKQLLKAVADKKTQAVLLKPLILALIVILAFASRLYSVIRYESVIHEFDPYFNFRSTKMLVEHGIYQFLNWFDEGAWYPLGRIVGGTVYPGLQASAAFIWAVLHALNLTVALRNVCVFFAPLMSSVTVLAVYGLTKEIKNSAAGLVAAAMLGVVPGYISRSVAGSFDNEGVAIPALILTFYAWVKAVKTGSTKWAAATALACFYMAAGWGGYIFIFNLIPMHVLVLLFTGRYSARVYVAYSTFYVVATLLIMQVRFIGFQAVQSSEHMAALGTFVLLQVYVVIGYVRALLSEAAFQRAQQAVLSAAAAAASVALVVGLATGYISPWTGRFYSLLDPTYASKNIPIIASVSEHQPTTWASFFFDLHLLTLLAPAGLYYCFAQLTDASIFAILYALFSAYFTGVMVRLMLVLSPAMCVLGGIAVSCTLESYMRVLAAPAAAAGAAAAPTSKYGKAMAAERLQPSERRLMSLGVVVVVSLLLIDYQRHATWVTSNAYSSPSIVLSAKQRDGSLTIFDDFREAYRWIDMNTAPDARIASWWDYGYQLAAMSNRTVLVDNNTWNNTHISLVGQMMVSDESDAFKIMQMLDIDYILVWAGALTGYASDDINKMLWMVRIGASTPPVSGKPIVEADYYNARGDYRIDKDASETMKSCLMYKLIYYRFTEMTIEPGKPPGWDRVRQQAAVDVGELTHLEEAFTSEHWLTRIYRVKKPANTGSY